MEPPGAFRGAEDVARSSNGCTPPKGPRRGPGHRRLAILVFLALAIVVLVPSGPAVAASAEQMDQAGVAALERLYATTPVAKLLASEAKGILIFPSVVKAGFILGAEYGNGILRKQGRTVGYYNLAAASYGLGRGAGLRVRHVLHDRQRDDLFRPEPGVPGRRRPDVVVMDQGMAKTLTTTTASPTSMRSSSASRD